MVKRFKEYLADLERGQLGEVLVFYHFKSDDVLARFILSQILSEGANHIDLGKGREIYFHKAHVAPGQDHLHFYQNNSKLYAINQDGTAHDRSHGKQMANWAQQGVKDNFPGFTIPKGGLIESLLDGKGSAVLNESFGSADPVLVSRALQLEALTKARDT